MNIFDELDETIKTGKERWNKIEALLAEVNKESPDNKTTQVLNLLIEHLKPLYNSEADFDLGKLFKSFAKKV